jgi:hypothetical protein
MKSKKLIAAFLMFAVLTTSTATVFASSGEGGTSNTSTQVIVDAKPISAPVDEVKRSNFGVFAGTVKSISDFKQEENSKTVLVEDGNGQQANFIISNKTYLVNDNKIEVGVKLTGYFDANIPMIMIYPAQYKAEVVIVGDIKETVKVDKFDRNLVSADGQLRIKSTEGTEIVTQDGKKYEGNLFNKNLVVTYGIATKSIPAQTTPIKIVVLDKEVTQEPGTISKPGKDIINDKRRFILFLIELLEGLLK